MRTPIQGLHHVTVMASDPQANIDFYTQVLGQRLIKKTVNFDDPGTYHLYYGDERGTPGSVLTFFPWPAMKRGRIGAGETLATAYSVPPASLDYWRERLQTSGLDARETERFGETVLAFPDPDGMTLELIANPDAPELPHWARSPVPKAHALRGFHSVSLQLARTAPTAAILTDHLGYREVGSDAEEARTRYQATETTAAFVDLLERPNLSPGQLGAGSVHHIAFRTRDDAEQAEYLSYLRAQGLNVTPVQDRQYFHSIYFREPGGVLFEVATDAPGFLYDEDLSELGKHLKLPDWYEARRADIEAKVPPVTNPEYAERGEEA